MKTLKVSSETLNELRTPFVWSRPRGRLYDYHNEIGGLYYQPMIRYICSREAGGQREIVTLPSRTQSNYDRIVYRRRQDEEDLQEFLTMYYAKRLKDVNSKTVHVKNELMRWSKDPKSLNMVRGSANIRDRYLCKLQLLHTENQAEEARERANRGEMDDEFELEEDYLPIVNAKEDEDVDKYEPGYEKIVEDRRQILKEKLMRKREYYAIDKAMKERMSAIMDRTKNFSQMQNVESNVESNKTSSVHNVESSESNMTKNVTTKSYKMEWHQEGGEQKIKRSFASDWKSQDQVKAQEETGGEVKAIGNLEKRFERAAMKANIYSRGQLDKPKVRYCLPRW